MAMRDVPYRDLCGCVISEFRQTGWHRYSHLCNAHKWLEQQGVMRPVKLQERDL
jgi:hypothetical protein